ncbi:glyoxalase [Saccharopolyspora sp. HNM0983]|uniref:Glyoxalase n=1 Tax=Saccharopolyspora montiporae TaxID=2781240 RepID=A0A929G122_9PSEU|nr:VOC family protein [Saccharopolyspora sp. HNM0983]MBE9375894.1 glyoxalase [Saccharopolyspora sp. HNM0983]
MKTFINLPVSDLDRSKRFFTELGFDFDPEVTDENASCVILGQDSYVMLLTESFFGRFTRHEVVDATRATEVIIALNVDSRGEVDDLVGRALAAGAELGIDAIDEGPMYSRNFHDPDGHLWEAFYMDPSAFSAD